MHYGKEGKMAASLELGTSTTALLILDFFCVVPCVVLKFPQLWSVYKAKNIKGLSWPSTILEMTSFTIFALYMFVTNKSIMHYLEYIFLIGQAWLLILMMLYYSNRMDFVILPCSALYFAATAVIGSGMTPQWFSTLLLTLSMPMAVVSMVLQILAMYNLKDSGSVSFTSWFIAWATGFLRLISALIVGDLLVVCNYASTNILRFVGCGAILYYRPQAKKFN